MKYIVLAVVGGVGVYLIWKGGYLGQWFPDLFGPSTGSTGDAAAKKALADAAALKAQQAAAAAAVDPTNAQKVADARRLADEAAAKKLAADKAAADAAKPPATPPPPPAARTYKPSDVVSCPTGEVATWANGTTEMRNVADSAKCNSLDSSSVVPVVPPAGSKMDQIQNLALASGEGALLTIDQWCYFAGQIGITCPDPGEIDPALYAGAWGEGTDRTTPIAVDTFWYLITVTDPSLVGMNGLSEIGLAGIGWLT